MSGTTIGGLSAATVVNTTDLLPLEQGTVTNRATIAQVLAPVSAVANAALPNSPTALGTLFVTWMATLPTTLPGSAGVAWNNGGVPSIS